MFTRRNRNWHPCSTEDHTPTRRWPVSPRTRGNDIKRNEKLVDQSKEILRKIARFQRILY
ncbi:hypothetical protein T4E_11622 [Trichinella pseudospiralis]|uniref:Uncharacterized protein n=1 Tax=Trichinella pseudospiralis TaxID=6337 RepID=A0A0V0XRE0_TRIPS|nr:hypothetical protein T4E_11622 [Trichinella pseudospiralis]